MKSSIIILIITPFGLAAASRKLFARDILTKRQTEINHKFIPPSKYVDSCEANGLVGCGKTWCLDVKAGDVCCKATYACPGRSFCLTEGYCCPDGIDPKTCATRFGVELPSDYYSTESPVPSTASSSSSAPPAPTLAPPPSTPEYTPSATASLPVPSNGTAPSATMQPPVFTGAAAAARYVGVGGWMAAVAAMAAGVFV